MTVNWTGVECVSAPLVPTTWIVFAPTAAPFCTATVSVLLVDAGFGLNEQDVFAVNPEQDKPTALLNPLTGVTVQVLVLLFPHAMLNEEGLHAMLKSPTGGAAVLKLNAEANEPGPQPLFARARQK